jgi:hypothetical protein
MKSYGISKNEAKAAIQKKENASDKISKSASNKTSITFKF